MGGDVVVTLGRVAVLGVGVSGIAAAEAADEAGATVGVFAQAGRASAILDRRDVPLIIDADGDSLARKVLDWKPSIVVASPGISPQSPLLRSIELAGVPVWSEVELAWRLQEDSSRRGRPWLLITGTNGKTTTVGILTEILRSAGEDVAEVGNVGLPITSQITGPATVFAVEVSSFQLENMHTVSPEAAICLNIEVDHLDWHGSAEAYRDAKGTVYRGVTGARCYFASDEVVALMAREALVPDSSFLLPLTLGAPKDGQIGIDGTVVVDRSGGTYRKIADLSEAPFLSERNFPRSLLQDTLAAVALALSHGVEHKAIGRALSLFTPDAHRGSLVAESRGIRWVDDSKATNAHAAQAALADLPDGTAVWIAGGDEKGQDFADLVRVVAPKLRQVILIGKEQGELRRALYHHGVETPIVEVMGRGTVDQWMSTVVTHAHKSARPGDTVILAPACASWDQFESYAHRGRTFSDAVLDSLRSSESLGE